MITPSFTQGVWIQQNDFPGAARTRAVCFAIGAYGYFGTGNHTSPAVAETADFWKYDAAGDSWLQVTNVPNGMQAACGSSSNTNGYVGLGWWASNGHPDFYEYNPSSDTWLPKANYNGNLTNDAVSVSLGGLIFAGTGGQPYSANCWDDWHSYDPATNSWSNLTIFPGVDRRNAGGFAIGTDIYVGCGQLENGAGVGTDFYKYTSATNTWTAMATCPSINTASSRNAGFSLNGLGYLVLPDGLWEYNPTTDSWSSNSLPFNLGVAAAFVVNGRAYVVLSGTNQVWEWTQCTNTTGSDILTACDTYTAPDGAVYTSTGIYMAVITNAAGCDSTITIDLTVNNSTTGSATETVCDTYTAPNGMIYTSTGMYTAIIPNAVNCDSTITIDLTVNNSTTSSISETALDSYTAPSGAVYTTSGVFNDTIANAAGCDSVITITLTMNHTGIEELNHQPIFLTPNPTSDFITIEGIEKVTGIKSMELVSSAGRVIAELKVGTVKIDVSTLSSGTYFLSITHANGTERIRFVKE